MNSSEIFEVIEEIARTSSKKEKEALIKAHAGDATFITVLKDTYDPFRTYGIAKLPVGKAHIGYRDFDAATSMLLDSLRTRALTGTAARDAVELEIDSLTEPSSTLLRRIIS